MVYSKSTKVSTSSKRRKHRATTGRSRVALANCAAIVVDGEIDMDMQQILSDEEVEDKNVRLTCIGSAATDEVKIVYNAKHLDYLQNRVI